MTNTRSGAQDGTIPIYSCAGVYLKCLAKLEASDDIIDDKDDEINDLKESNRALRDTISGLRAQVKAKNAIISVLSGRQGDAMVSRIAESIPGIIATNRLGNPDANGNSNIIEAEIQELYLEEIQDVVQQEIEKVATSLHDKVNRQLAARAAELQGRQEIERSRIRALEDKLARMSFQMEGKDDIIAGLSHLRIAPSADHAVVEGSTVLANVTGSESASIATGTQKTTEVCKRAVRAGTEHCKNRKCKYFHLKGEALVQATDRYKAGYEL